jgi:methyl-accepting chemotaxis protein
VLSLNAGIEAARAGKNGRGFAVVAEEVRRLAERTAQSTRQVAKIVDGIQRETLRAVSSMQAAHEQVGVGRELSQQAAQALQRIHGGASQSLATVEQIAGATRELKGASLQIADHLGSLAVGTRKTDKTVQRATKEILGELSQFKQSASPSDGQPPSDPLPSVSLEALPSKP